MLTKVLFDSSASGNSFYTHLITYQFLIAGHCFMLQSDLLRAAHSFLQTQFYSPKIEDLITSLDHLKAQGRIISEIINAAASTDYALFLPSLHRFETSVARLLLELGMRKKAVCVEVQEPHAISQTQKLQDDVGLSKQQQDACILATKGPPLLILTGGPGTGKTVATCVDSKNALSNMLCRKVAIRAMVNEWAAAGLRVTLVSPTGRGFIFFNYCVQSLIIAEFICYFCYLLILI
jgi:hypothetical protein